jgi:glucose/arabinose dehydrogenase
MHGLGRRFWLRLSWIELGIAIGWMAGCGRTVSTSAHADAENEGASAAGGAAVVEGGGADSSGGTALAEASMKGEVDVSPDARSLDASVPGSDAVVRRSDGAQGPFCDLPGSVQFTASGIVTVTGADGSIDPTAQKLMFLQLPAGFCAHWFGHVGNARQLRFAPGGELFVASPTKGTTGGGSGGQAAIVVLPDDDLDGVADSVLTFADNLPATQGLLFANDHFYYQNGTQIWRAPYAMGERVISPNRELVANITIFSSDLHWPKTLDQADDGTIYVGNGANDGDACLPGRPFEGGILKLDGSPGGTPVAKGFRNPIAVRCQRGHNLCFAAELAKDYSNDIGGREKLVPIRNGDDWGFPCCLAKDLPLVAGEDCSGVTPEDVGFYIGDTPFSFDFERGRWPAPYNGSVFVPLHGAAGSWKGARIVAVAIDPASGLPQKASDVTMTNEGALTDFATGWEDGTYSHGRPAAIAFAEDGRMFVGNDNDGSIFWVAPLDLE